MDDTDRSDTERDELELTGPELDEVEQAEELVRKAPPKRGEIDPAEAAAEILELEAEKLDDEDELSGDDYVE